MKNHNPTRNFYFNFYPFFQNPFLTTGQSLVQLYRMGGSVAEKPIITFPLKILYIPKNQDYDNYIVTLSMPRRLYGCDMERTVAHDVLEEAFQTFLRKLNKPKNYLKWSGLLLFLSLS